ncbi:MAG: FG-GAP repeat protein [Candidatus Eisenbacteria bacterium]|nr:FG-GAP repeat protein [Candidatus Eisenbacteria bacterium]
MCANIEREEYHASVNAAGLQAPNRSQNLRTYFHNDRIELVPRMGESEPAWRFSWRSTHWGRADRPVEVSSEMVEPQANGTRVIYRRQGLDEWYENGKQGLEQGFTIHARPGGNGDLVIRGEWGGNLHAAPAAEDGAIDFLDENSARALRYGGLHVTDAAGATLPSRLVHSGRQLAILITDEEADYPLTVDPLLSTPSWTAEGNQASCRFGYSVGTAGDVNGDGYSDVIVGAYGYDNGQINEGRAFVYHGSAGGLATSPAWMVESNQQSAAFAEHVGTAGDVNGDGYGDVIIGAAPYDNGQTDEGRAFVYHGSAGGLATSPAWTGESNQENARYGTSIGTAGDVNGDGYGDIIVGAPWYANGQNTEGRAYVYHGSPGGLAASAAWMGEYNQAAAHFGMSVGTAGDVNGDGYADVIVGAPLYENGQGDEGRVFVYHGSSAGLAASPAWTAESDQAGAQCGFSVGTAGDVNGDGYADVIVSAVFYNNGQVAEGRAYVYHGSLEGLTANAAWTAESDQTGAHFGNSVGTAGDVNGDGYADVIVGADSYDNGQTDEGRAYVYCGSSGGLAAGAVWTAEGDQATALYGQSVGTAGDVNGDGYSDVIVGAVFYDSDLSDEGRAYVYHGSAGGLAANAGWTAESDHAGASFGRSVATAGDVNGDGYSDVIVGAEWFDNGEENEGRAYVYHGLPGGLATSASWTADGDQAGAFLGCSVGTAGDVNGDGYADVIVGAKGYDNGEEDEGRATVYNGSLDGLAASAAWMADGGQAGALLGCSVGTAGDVNGDGFADVLIGAEGYDNGEENEGRVYLYRGTQAGLVAGVSWMAEGEQVNASFGHSVATAGDVNGDGYSDIIVGAELYDNGEVDEGRAYVYHGSFSGPSASAAWTAESDQADARLGSSAGTAGDVNGDGYSDVIIGAAGYDNGQTDEGRAFVYHGSAGGLGMAPAWMAESDQDYASFGSSVGTAGDVNGDGYSDVIVGSCGYDNGQTDEGRAYVYHGSSAGLAAIAAWIAESDQADARFALTVGTAGDVNGDGYSDVIIGAEGYDNGETDEGRVFVYYGNSGGGLERIARQARPDDSAPICILGLSLSDASVLLKALGRTPAGRGMVCLQVEIKPFGTPFDGAGLLTGPLTDTGTPSGAGSVIPLSELASGLTSSTLYHWRVRTMSRSPFFPRSPWLSLPDNNSAEADVRIGVVSSVETDMNPAAVLWMGPGAPNPFGAATEITYTLSERGRVRLSIYEASGRVVLDLVDEELEVGRHTARWNGCNDEGARVSAGVYFARLSFGGRVAARKIVLSR